jgi:hypothetical protein
MGMQEILGVVLFILFAYFVIKRGNANAVKLIAEEKELQNYLQKILQHGTEEQKQTALELYRKKQLADLRSLASLVGEV